MKILCVGSHRKPSNALLRAEAFKSLGHTVENLDTSRFGYFRKELLRRLTLGPGLPIVQAVLNRALIRKIETFQPDLVFLEKSTWLKSAVLKKIRRLALSKIKLVHYNPDDPFGHYNSRIWNTFIDAIPSYDVHFVPKIENVEEYYTHGALDVFPFDRSFDPNTHRPVILTPQEAKKFVCEVGFIGTWAVNREVMIAGLIRDGIPVAVWGDGWQRGANWEIIRPFWRGPTQVGDDYAKAISGMQIALHFLRRENRDEQDSRTFEIPACGAFMLAERSPAHERLFKDGEEAVYFDSIEDLYEKVSYYLQHDDARERIRRAGLERVTSSGYDHASRLSQLLALTQ